MYCSCHELFIPRSSWDDNFDIKLISAFTYFFRTVQPVLGFKPDFSIYADYKLCNCIAYKGF